MEGLEYTMGLIRQLSDLKSLRYGIFVFGLLFLVKLKAILEFMYLKELYYELFSPREDYWGIVFKRLKARAHEEHMERLRAESANGEGEHRSEVDLAMIQTDTTVEFELEGEAVYENFVWMLDNEVVHNLKLLTEREKKAAIRIHKKDVENYINIEVI